ncbi:HNH endonuclease [Nakamurella aerolata]|uniref:DUF222 domain-containing protein n=1 Tax=Nakamurella aerolata TaxID=1656892 RepID=A0A849A2P6_9ACTN|nr:HNH endonuclease signature motif containing protein [Nakamurella aerolata]NNG34879.1 DUF222 domain-containing protein [Nakamurella aerolata]
MAAIADVMQAGSACVRRDSGEGLGMSSASPPAAADTGAAADAIAQACAELTALLAGAAASPDRAAAVDRLAALEQLVGAANGAIAAQSLAFAEAERARQVAAGVSSRQLGRGVAEQIAFARRMSPAAASHQLGVARALRDRLPQTFARLREGELSLAQCQIVCRESSSLEDEQARLIDNGLAGQLHGWSLQQTEQAVRQAVYTLDPHGSVDRRARAAKQRRVTIRPLPDAMTMISALLPMELGVGIWTSLTRQAEHAIGVGDERTKDQLRADALAERLLSSAHEPAAGLTLVKDAEVSGSHIPKQSDASGGRNAAHANDSEPGSDPACQARSDAPGQRAHRADRTPGRRSSDSDTSVSVIPPAHHGGATSESATAEPETESATAKPEAPASHPTARRSDPAEPPAGENDPPRLRRRSPLYERFGDAQATPLASAEGSVPRPPNLDVHLVIVMTADTLLGYSDRPAKLDGYGPIPAELARDFASGDSLHRRDNSAVVGSRDNSAVAASSPADSKDNSAVVDGNGALGSAKSWRRAKVRLTRMLVDPIDGVPVGMDARRRDFTGVLRELVLHRDPQCAQPFCSARSRHADHVVPYAAGGTTTLENGQGLCASGNYVKEIPGWRTERRRQGTVVTTPTGHRYLTERTPPLGLPPKAWRL